MTFELKEGQIFIHKNTNADGNKPVIKGSLMVAGVEYEVALWGSKSGKEGSYSGKVSLPRKHAYPSVQDHLPETHKGLDKQGDIPQKTAEIDDEVVF